MLQKHSPGDTTLPEHEVLRFQVSKMDSRSDVKLVSSRLIQAIETTLNPSTAQQQRAEAYEVRMTQLFAQRLFVEPNA